MITQTPYGFGFGHKAYRVGAEPDRAAVSEFVPTNDPPEIMEHCFSCTVRDCPGYCDKMPEVKRRRKYNSKLKERDREAREKGRLELAAILDRKEPNRIAAVAKMFMDGWSESGISRELGITVRKVESEIKTAQKLRWLD